MVDNASPDGTADAARAAARRRARPGPAQRRATAARATRCGAACWRRAATCGCTATPTARLVRRRCRRMLELDRRSADVVVGSRLADGRAASAGASRCGAGSSGARSCCCAARCCASRRADLFCGFKLWRADAGRGRLRARRARRLDVRRRDARDGPRARLPAARDRDRVDRPRGLAAVDAARARAGGRASCSRRARAPSVRARASRGPRRPPESAEAAEPRAELTCAAGSRRRGGRAGARSRARAGLSPGCCCASGCKGGVRRPAATATSCSTRCSTSTGCARPASHVLIGNLYDLAPGPAHVPAPGAADLGRAGRARARGRPSPTCCGSRSPCSRCWPGARRAGASRFLPERRGDRRGLALALFFASPLAALVAWSGLGRIRRQASSSTSSRAS